MTADSQYRPPRRTDRDASTPVLLLVALAAVFAVVIGIVTVSRGDSVLALVGTIAVLLLGMVAVTTTIARQLSDTDGDAPPPPAADGDRRHDSIEAQADKRRATGPARRARPGMA
jgi:hypothetical protein